MPAAQQGSFPTTVLVILNPMQMTTSAWTMVNKLLFSPVVLREE